MCGTCGCGGHDEPVKIQKPGEEEHQHSYTHAHEHEHGGEEHRHEHRHEYVHKHSGGSHHHSHEHEHEHAHHHDHHDHHHHDHGHHHHHDHGHSRQINIEADALQKNNLTAERNRGYFEAKNILALNLVSSPGSGKTSLLEKTIQALKDKTGIWVIEGDQQTMNDANRIQQAGAPVVQVNTGNGCHLDADMVNRAMKKLEIANDGILMIENVGNLVCPSLFDLGEAKRVVVISVTEGDDKPLKYPTMFETSDICIINKTDLLPYVDFDVEKSKEYARRVNPDLQFFELSVRTGEGMEKWIEWVMEEQKGHEKA
ncbi:MAG: hydrogenase nickel incorporation protein HypB [Bacteroidales bacterium]